MSIPAIPVSPKAGPLKTRHNPKIPRMNNDRTFPAVTVKGRCDLLLESEFRYKKPLNVFDDKVEDVNIQIDGIDGLVAYIAGVKDME